MSKKHIASKTHIGSEADPALAVPLGMARVLSNVRFNLNGCWLFQGFTHPNGYGDLSYMGKNWRVHRLAFHLWKGPIPEGHDICHTCDVRNCVNPDHLWSGPRRMNNRDTTDKRRNKNTQKTHCPRGHAYEEHGRIYAKGYKGWRACLICQRARCRIALGWPADLAYSAPVTPHGHRPWANRTSAT